MKIRGGHVSNSSSSSFVLDKSKLSPLQLVAIRDHISIGEKLGIEYCDEREAWDIIEDDRNVKLKTGMDNFDMDEFLRIIEAHNAVIERYHS